MTSERTDSLQLQARDLDLLSGLFECRVMTRRHIGNIYFGKRHPYAKKRIQKLKAAGLIRERVRSANEPSILFLTRKGFTLLKDNGHLSKYPPMGTDSFEARANVKDGTLRHELEIMDVKSAFHTAVSDGEVCSIKTFTTWPLLNQFEISRPSGNTMVKPDGFVLLHKNETGSKGHFHDCFLELDRSSEVQDALVNKAICYLEYYKSGGYALRNGASRSNFKDFPFRVLIVFKSAERRNNTAERLIHNIPPILTQTWLTTFAEAITNPLGTIWTRPADYRDVTRGTRYYNEYPNRSFEYRRLVEREEYVEGKIKKWGLFEPPIHSISPAEAVKDSSRIR